MFGNVRASVFPCVFHGLTMVPISSDGQYPASHKLDTLIQITSCEHTFFEKKEMYTDTFKINDFLPDTFGR